MLGQVQILARPRRLVVLVARERDRLLDLRASRPIVVAGHRHEARSNSGRGAPGHPVVLAVRAVSPQRRIGRPAAAAVRGAADLWLGRGSAVLVVVVVLALIEAGRHRRNEQQAIAIGGRLEQVPVLPGAGVVGAVAGDARVEAVQVAPANGGRVLFGAARRSGRYGFFFVIDGFVLGASTLFDCLFVS